MKQAGKVSHFHGIVVAGETKQKAVDAYRRAATGLSAKAYQAEDKSFLFLSNSDDKINPLNPLTGEMDLVEADSSVMESMSFAAADSKDQIECYHAICGGCESHLIADDNKFIKRCIVCSSDKFVEEEQANVETVSGYAGVIVCGDTMEQAKEAFVKAINEPSSLTGYSDEANQVSFSSVSSVDFNPFTGEQDVAEDTTVEFKQEATAANGEQLQGYYFVCANTDDCGQHVISSSEDPVFCPKCSSGLLEPDFSAESSDDEEDDFSEEDLDDADSEDSDSEESDDSENSEEDDSESEDPEEESDESDSEEEDEESDESDESDENSLELGSDEEADESDDESSDDEDMESESNAKQKKPAKMKTTETISESTAVPVEMTKISMNMLKVVASGSDLDAADFEVAHCGTVAGKTTWTAFYKGVPVGIATSVSAVKHSEIFETPTFGRIAIAAAKENGVEQAMTEMGFQPIVQEVDVQQHVAKSIEEGVGAKIAEVTAAANTEREQFNERFHSALSISAVGINRGFFKNVSNPVKAALISSLSAAGVRDADVLVDRAFANNSDQYNRNLVAKAMEIVSKPVEIQNQLAEAVENTNYQSESSVRTNVEDRLENFGTPSKTNVMESVSTTNTNIGDDKMKRVVANLGRRQF